MDDASLDEFVTTDDGTGDGEGDGTADEEQGATDDGPTGGEAPSETPADVAPAASTYAWTGDGAVCGACGESVARRWQDGDELVCADCKEW
jgi:hypothetical protein